MASGREGQEPPLLVLPGALGVVDGGGGALDLLARSRRLIPFSYATERTVEALFERALGQVGADEKFDLIGFSVGGWLAQCLAARHPKRVRKLVLAHSFTLEPGDRWRFALAARLWPLLPRSLFGGAVRKRARMALRGLAERDPVRCGVLLARVRATIDAPGTAALLQAQQHAVADSLRGGCCTASCPVLIVEGADDPILSSAVREGLARKYPGAARVTLEGVGHAGAEVDPDGFVAAVDAFLRG